MMFLLNIFIFTLAQADIVPLTQKPELIFNNTRRILKGHMVGDTRPYMVYLRPAEPKEGESPNTKWLCGGVIIHERYILTSAACIEQVQRFYVVSGTHSWIPISDKDNECIKNGAKKAVWKCVPKSYVYDGMDFENIRWMKHDIAVVKVEDEFNFNRRIRGCDFIPQKIAYNNQSVDLEKPGTAASIAGWGTTSRFSDPIKRSSENSPHLLESDVQLISKTNCKRRWAARYHYIIDDSMICSKDSTDTDAMSTICSEQEVNCKEMVYSHEYEDAEDSRRSRLIIDPEYTLVHNALHSDETRRAKFVSGGFCENDHGGPLIVGHGKTSVVIGVISACQTKDITNICFGPFLYTSVWTHRHLISCAIDKDIGSVCRKFLRASKTQMSETTFDWSSHSDGPAKRDMSSAKVVALRESNDDFTDTTDGDADV